jgi:hypothetical protein
VIAFCHAAADTLRFACCCCCERREETTAAGAEERERMEAIVD